jgi:hypothetical protein
VIRLPRRSWTAGLGAVLVLACATLGCGPKHAPRATGSAAAPSVSSPDAASDASGDTLAPSSSQGAFSVDGRVTSDGHERRLKLRFYALAPDRFRMEIRGVVGGIALVATGEQGRVRIVLPSKRRFAEAGMDEDVGSGLIGIPITGCDLAMVMRIASGMKRFQPCATPEEAPPPQDDAALDAPPTDADRPGYIVDTSPAGMEMVRYGFDWSGPLPFPKEVRIEIQGAAGSMLALTNFKPLVFPKTTDESFFREPAPEGSARVPASDLAADPSS